MVVRVLLICGAACFGLAGQAAAEIALRVRVAQDVHAVRLAGPELRVDNQLVDSGEIRVIATEGQVHWARQSSRNPVEVRAAGGIALDGRTLTGALALIPLPGDRMDVVNVVPLERYVQGAVSGEVYASWPTEVLRAQAVVARTYALYERARNADQPQDLEASVISQRYAIGQVPTSIRRATRETRGQYLAFGGEPILAAFHASAGGQTASSLEVWGDALPYLKSVRSPDDSSPEHFWSYEIDLSDFLDALREAGWAVGGDRLPQISRLSASGRVEALQIAGAELSGRELRQVLGGRGLRSALFELRVDGETVRFLGSGAGHGVGLSQWGARELAARGRTYRQILAHYYPGTELRRLELRADLTSGWSEGE